MTLFTVGHSTRTLEEFVELLHAHGVRRLVDVRRFPGSRRHPHFSRESLERLLPSAGIAYVHERELGGRRTPLPDSPNGAWRVAGFRAYADHMADPEWQRTLERVLAEAELAPSAIMCAEAVPWRCHRRLIADAAVARGIEVLHILAPTRADRHELSPHAVLGPGFQLRYPAPGQEQAELF